MKTIKLYWDTICLSFLLSFRASVSIMIYRLIFLIVGAFVPIINAVSFKRITDGLIDLNYKELIFWLFILGVTQIFTAILSKINNFLAEIHNDKISLIITTDITCHVNSLDISYFDSPMLYNEIINTSSDITTIPSLIWSVLSSLQIFVQIVVSFAILSCFGIWIPFVIIVTCLPNFIIDRKNAIHRYSWGRDNVNEVRKIRYSYDTLVSKYFCKDIRTKNIFDYLKNKYVCQWKDWYIKKNKMLIKHFFSSFITMFFPHIATLVFAYFLIINISNNKNTVGDFTYYIGIMNQFIACVFSIIANISEIIQQKIKIENYNKFKEWQPNVKNCEEDAIIIKEILSIEFKNVSFAYPNTDKLVLKDISFVINAKEKIGIVGKNGCGKSTLIKLLLALYKPTCGEILVNGINIQKCNIKSYRRLLSEMQQDYVNYSFSLKENMMTADIDNIVDEERIIKACKMGDAYDFVDKWKNGFDTCLTKSFDENGVELSGGQWQKLALSRFFYRKAQFYIMDEPSASLDVESESNIFNNMLSYLSNAMILLISHKLSVIKMMDKIIVLDNGEIAESGSHEYLIKRGGIYTDLFNMEVCKFN